MCEKNSKTIKTSITVIKKESTLKYVISKFMCCHVKFISTVELDVC